MNFIVRIVPSGGWIAGTVRAIVLLFGPELVKGR